MTRSETFRALARHLNAEVRDIDDDTMFHIAATHMPKEHRRKVVALLKDFESGALSYKDIQKLWAGSSSRFYMSGERSVRLLFFRARLVLEKSFDFGDIEDLRAGKTIKRRPAATQLSASDNRTFLRLAQHFAEIQSLDPDFQRDRQKLLLKRLTPEDRVGLEKLAAGIARGKVTEDLLRSRWRASGQPPFSGRLTALVFDAARLVEAADRSE